MTSKTPSLPLSLTGPARKGPPRYWEGILRTHLEAELSLEDLATYQHWDDEDCDCAHLAESAAFRLEFLSERRFAQLQPALLKWMGEAEPEQGWNPRHANFIVWIWEEEERHGEPQGFMTMDLSVERTRAGKITSVDFSQDLIWIAPKHRGRKLGRYLVGAAIEWLSLAKAYGDQVASRGVAVNFFAEPHTKGGHALACALLSHFKLIQEFSNDGVSPQNLGWHIRSVIDDIDG